MKEFIKKYKEIIISLIVILIIILISLINFKSNYSKEYNFNEEKQNSNQAEENITINSDIESSYYINDGKLYNDNIGKDEIKDFGNFSEIEDGPIQYLEFVDENNGFMYRIEDVAMTIAWGTISKTTDGGKTWVEVSNRNR